MRTINLSNAAFTALARPAAVEWARLTTKCATAGILGGPYSRRGIFSPAEIRKCKRNDNAKRVALGKALQDLGLTLPSVRSETDIYPVYTSGDCSKHHYHTEYASAERTRLRDLLLSQMP